MYNPDTIRQTDSADLYKSIYASASEQLKKYLCLCDDNTNWFSNGTDKNGAITRVCCSRVYKLMKLSPGDIKALEGEIFELQTRYRKLLYTR